MNNSLQWSHVRRNIDRGNISLSAVCIGVILLCALMTGFVSQSLLSFAVLAISILLVISGDIYLVFPIMLFYYESFGQLMGMSTYRYFSLLFLFAIILMRPIFTFRFSQFVPFFLFVIYCGIVIAPDNVRKAIFAVVDIVCILALVNYFLCDERKMKKFFTVYAFTAICAFFTGVFLNRSHSAVTEINGEFVEIVRNYATFEDPNYAGLFYTLAIFAVVTLKLFKPAWRAAIVIALYAMVLTTLSITAIIVNILLWLLYLIVFKKINAITGVCLILVVIILLGLYAYGLSRPSTPVIGMLSLRISDKLNSLESNDIDSVTTNRSALTERHWQFFQNQSPFRMLVGMNAASTLKTDLNGDRGAAHNEYVDLLLNIGIFGTILYLGTFLSRGLVAYQGLRTPKSGYWGCIFMTKAIWLLYALTLTMFGDYRFMLLFFL